MVETTGVDMRAWQFQMLGTYINMGGIFETT